ncbi:uncharacterized protein LOC126896690 isoform X2 [Daktulosphaira vitifoliae]|uniref:uncharacterized protein LOC126896690 isoform X2 n=1 Tax=Daktulosphaira vitifoliae TaxID=58002 RepID=UPI0021AA2509|nr:uncharacterized protein LOC126896690 isoform X2 [Daktulosphaira vitifoliae]
MKISMKTKTNSPLILTLLILLMIGVTVSDDDKWVWGRSNDQSRADSRIGTVPSGDVSYVARPILRDPNGRRPNLLFQPANNPRLENKRYRDEPLRGPRYEVNEDFLPDREPLIPQPANHVSEAFANRPVRPLSGAGPIYQPTPALKPQRPLELANIPLRRPIAGASEPQGATVGILTGPVPSWQGPVPHRNGDPTNFEKCKCSFSFNCKSPGIKFGSCDQGKQYCCYNDFDDFNAAIKDVGGDRSEPVPSVLVGPGANRPGLRPGIYGQVPNNNVRNKNK